MNRRGFISLLAGAAGGVLVPWCGLVEPTIVLPPQAKIDVSRYFTSGNAWFIRTDQFSNRPVSSLTEEALDDMLDSLRYMGRIAIQPRRLIVSPEVKRLIDTDPVIAEAARIALGGG